MSSQQKSDDVCVVCCRTYSIHAVGPCDHRVCFVCSSRMRVLCQKNECPICRQDMPHVIFTKTEHPYSMLSKLKYRMDHKYKIMFASDEIQEEYHRLLEEACPVCPDRQKFHSFGHLKDHLRRQYEMFFCDLCVEHLKLFTFERRCYNRKDLARHRKTGDPEDTSHKGHPLCIYCDQRYLDKDDLYRHLRKDHYYCHFCDADGTDNSFYLDYDLLYDHFHKEHYICEEGSCKEDRYTGVFRTDIDLIAHRAAHHSKNLTKQQAKQARTLELNFSITPRPSQQNGNSMNGEYERDGYNRRGGHRGPKGSRREKQNEKDSRMEMVMSIPERLSPIPEPINMQSEREFPHLSTSATSLNTNATSENQNPAKNNRSDKSKKWNSAVMSFEDHFPSLSTPNTPSAAANTFTVQLKNKDHTANRPNISIQVFSKPEATNQGKASVGTPQTTFTIVQPSRAGQPSVNGNAKNTFEQNFPVLVGRENVRTTVTVPIWKKCDEPKPAKTEACENVEFVEVKSKHQKKAEKNSVFVQPKQKASSENGNKKKKKEPLENGSVSHDNGPKMNGESLDTPASNLPKKTLNNADNTEEVQQKAHKLVMDDFPALESPYQNKAVAHPGFSAAKQSKKAQPPPGFAAPKPSISISLSSVAQELTMPSTNNNTDLSSFDNSSNPATTTNATYMEPQDFQLRNQNLIQEIHQVLQNNAPVFDQFKTLSGQFRQNLISPTEYYERCIELFGKENFNKILPELLVLLPDIAKQQELLSIYNRRRKKDAQGCGAVPKNGACNVANTQFMVCASCQQVLCNRDFRDHMEVHSSDFPTLVQPNRTTARISWMKK